MSIKILKDGSIELEPDEKDIGELFLILEKELADFEKVDQLYALIYHAVFLSYHKELKINREGLITLVNLLTDYILKGDHESA